MSKLRLIHCPKKPSLLYSSQPLREKNGVPRSPDASKKNTRLLPSVKGTIKKK